MEKHHIFPQEPRLARWFGQQGINIHEYTLLIPLAVHRRIRGGSGGRGGLWNEEWRRFMEARPHATPEEVWRDAIHLIVQYDLTGASMGPCRQGEEGWRRAVLCSEKGFRQSFYGRHTSGIEMDASRCEMFSMRSYLVRSWGFLSLRGSLEPSAARRVYQASCRADRTVRAVARECAPAASGRGIASPRDGLGPFRGDSPG
jgi:hypothetical protein